MHILSQFDVNRDVNGYLIIRFFKGFNLKDPNMHPFFTWLTMHLLIHSLSDRLQHFLWNFKYKIVFLKKKKRKEEEEDCAMLYACGFLSFCILHSLILVRCLQEEKDLLENNCCPMHLKPCVPRKEDNYFFALSKYQKSLEDLLADNPDFVQPSFRLNEVRTYIIAYFIFSRFYTVVCVSSIIFLTLVSQCIIL